MDVLLASKMVVGSGCTFMARQGYAAATGYSHENDCPDVYFGDMMRAGRGSNYPGTLKVNGCRHQSSYREARQMGHASSERVNG